MVDYIVMPAEAGISLLAGMLTPLDTSEGLSMPRMLKARPGDGPTHRSFAAVTGIAS